MTLAPMWSNPAYIAESRLHANLRDALGDLCRPCERWIDVGCGTRPYEHLFRGAHYIGVDVPRSGRAPELKKPSVFYDGHSLPFHSASVDGALCTQVLEHVPSPDALIGEMARVVKPQGHLVLTAPFVWQEHEQPYDFHRFTTFGLRALVERHRFEVLSMRRSAGAIETIAQALSISLATAIRLRIPGVGRLVTLLLCFPVQALGMGLQRLLPDAGSLFLDCVVIARRRADP